MKKTFVLMIFLVICMAASAIAAEVFVSEIRIELITRGPSKSGGSATIYIMNDSGQLVTSGTVSAQWSGAATNSTTSSIGSDGTATSNSDFATGGGTFTIEITDVSVSGYTYNPSLNAVTRTYISSNMISYSWAGIDREYYLHVPLDKPTSGMPLMFVLHGANQDEVFHLMENTDMSALGDKYGFAVVYPQSYLNDNGNYWWTAGHPNDGPGDDTGFLTSLAQYLQNQYGFSPDYTFTSGFSNGGGMSYRLACEASDVFAGAAPVAGYIAQPIYDNCNPSNTVSVIATHGTNDLTVRYDGVVGEYPSAPEATNYWAQLNGCTDTTVEILYGGALERTKHTGGLNGSEVWLHTWGGAHAWNSPDFDTSEEIWAFFNQVVMGGGPVCDDGTCDPGEDQCNCPEDCGTPPTTELNCSDGIDDDCDTYTDCDDGDCIGDPACPSCGDATCGSGEDQCNCPEDCGTPPSTETNCTDGIDEDCDTYTDCDDLDCDTDPACIDPYCGDETCDPGEDQCNCPDDCGTPPSTETSCTDGIDNDCDLDTDCDDADCDGDPACPSCLPKGAICSDNSECCSGTCAGVKCKQQYSLNRSG